MLNVDVLNTPGVSDAMRALAAAARDKTNCFLHRPTGRTYNAMRVPSQTLSDYVFLWNLGEFSGHYCPPEEVRPLDPHDPEDLALIAVAGLALSAADSLC